MPLLPDNVYVRKSYAKGYQQIAALPPVELPNDTSMTTAAVLLRDLLADATLDTGRFGTPEWNPLGDLIRPGAKVLIKPNWVQNRNYLPGNTLESVITHRCVIEAVLHYVIKANPALIIVGDAPIQSCDFENLTEVCCLEDMVKRFERLGHEIQIRDFRLTRMTGRYDEKLRVMNFHDRYSLFDLSKASWLAPITDNRTRFRVTNYDPDIIGKHHNVESHRYLVAKEILDADIIINVPKLKTHKKAGLTGALKNMVGINGFKEYLPHHRKGGSAQGGDCYEGYNWFKDLAEDFLDRANRVHSRYFKYLYANLAKHSLRVASHIFGHDSNLEGNWWGNDTVWRMVLDLQRIVHYGKSDGQMAETKQREVISITDGIVGGEGDGPVSTSPVSLGVMTLGINSAAIDWVHCLLVHLDPNSIPVVAHAFNASRWPLTDFSPNDIRVYVNGEVLMNSGIVADFGVPFSPPNGWKGHCELNRTRDAFLRT